MNKTRHILDALRKKHDAAPGNGPSKPWVFVEEVRISTGFSTWQLEPAHALLRRCGEQRIDAFAMHAWPSKQGLRIAYEVKVSRTDLIHELNNPEKSAAAMHLSNEFYLVVLDELVVATNSLPDEWGLMRVGEYGNVRTVRKAEWRESPTPPYTFMLSVARNLQAAQHKSR